MSPSETSELDGYLEHPIEALQYFHKQGIASVICEEKHMGSRAVVIVCKNESVVRDRFGIENEGIGVCYTRTGRNFFNDVALESAFIGRLQIALTNSGFWEKFNTEWVCLDAELMPWSAKAQALLKDQYAAVGASATAAIGDVVSILEETTIRNIDGIDILLSKYSDKREMVSDFVKAYQGYCWPVDGLAGYKLAPFHILASEGAVHVDKDHAWHMNEIQAICNEDQELLMMTPYKIVDPSNEDESNAAVAWWTDLTEKGGEGMVIKPLNFIARGKRDLAQPAIKCRGREYLRIIYGPEYNTNENLDRLKSRGLSGKRSLALREFALGVEALERFVKKEPLRRVHECVFGVLALESEEIDPRL